jgi:geranylgeranyl pyrophosphate synthase
MSAKGKRIRPILTMLSCDALGGKIDDSINVAIAIELLHNFTLVHDDIMDQDNLRHGQPTVHNKWDVATAVLTGDSLLWLSLHLLKKVEQYREDVILHFIDAIKLVCEGQAYDKIFETEDFVSIEQYEKMISMKTGYMIGLCSHLGAVCAGADIETQNKMKAYGLEIGRAYQIQDDYMEMYFDENTMRKSLGSDIELNKKTYMICLGLELDPVGLSSILDSNLDMFEKVKSLKQYFKELEIKDRTISEISKSFRLAEDILSDIELENSHLSELNKYLINRRY